MPSADDPVATHPMATHPVATPAHDQSAPPAREAPLFELGILMVHGVAVREAGQTLVHWSDALLKTIARATRGSIATAITHAGPGRAEGAGDDLEAEIALVHGDATTRWLIREAEWSHTFPPASYAQLVSWGFTALPWTIVTHVAGRYWQSSGDTSRLRRIWAFVRAVGSLVFALAISPLLLAVSAASLVLGLIPQVRPFVQALQAAATLTIGDSLAFVDSPTRAAMIRTRVVDGLARLQAACRCTVVVAHSQGAAIVMDVLGGMSGAGPPGHARADAPRAPDALVTFGAGTNQLASMRVLAAGGGGKSQANPALLAVWGLVGVVGPLLWFFLRHDSIGLPLAEAALVLGGILGAFGAMGLLLHLQKRWPGSRISKMAAYGAVLFYIGWVIVFILVAERIGLRLLPVTVLVPAAIMLIVALRACLSDKLKAALTAPVRAPPGVPRWVDLYASADPVPNGPTRTGGDGVHDSVEVWNLGSPLADHNAYWENRDGFVLRVVRICAETAHSAWTQALPPQRDTTDRRAAWRVVHLRLARIVTVLSWLGAGALLWRRRDMLPELTYLAPSWVPLPQWLHDLLAQWEAFPALVVAGIFATYGLQRWLWSKWTAAEQDAVLAPGDDVARGDPALTRLGIALPAAGLLALALMLLVDPAAAWLALMPLLLSEWPVRFAAYVMYRLAYSKGPPDIAGAA